MHRSELRLQPEFGKSDALAKRIGDQRLKWVCLLKNPTQRS